MQQQPDHPLGDVEVGDGPLAQRPDGHDVAGRAADHLPGVLAHGQDVLGPCVEGDHRRLVEHDALAPRVDEGVGGAEVDGEIPSHVAPLARRPCVRRDHSGTAAGVAARRRRDVPSREGAHSNLGRDGTWGPVHRRGDSRRSRRSARRRDGRPSAGWLPPEDRLWRHPSEVVGHRTAPVERSVPRRGRRGGPPAGAGGVAGTPASWAWPPWPPPSPSCSPSWTHQGRARRRRRPAQRPDPSSVPVASTSLTSMPLVGHDVHRLVASVRPSLVALEPVDATTAPRMTGVVLPGGDARGDRGRPPWPARRSGRRDVHRQAPAGHRSSGSDPRSGVAVISTGGRADAGHVRRRGRRARATWPSWPACAPAPPRPSSSGTAPRPRVGDGARRSGPAVHARAAGPTSSTPSRPRCPSGPTSWGGVLLDSHGQRARHPRRADERWATTPSGCSCPHRWPRVWRSSWPQTHHVDHGWLGVECSRRDPARMRRRGPK